MDNVLDGIITIPVEKPTELYQCGLVSTVYPPEWCLTQSEVSDCDSEKLGAEPNIHPKLL